MLVGRALGSLFAIFFGDWFGKKALVVGGLWFCLTGVAISLLRANLAITSAGMLMAEAGIQVSFYISFSLISEEVGEEYRSKLMVMVQIVFGLGVILNVLWTYLFENWVETLFYFYIIPLIICIVGITFLVIETPICLITRY